MSHCTAIILSFPPRSPLSLPFSPLIILLLCQACRFASGVLNRHKQQYGSNILEWRVRQSHLASFFFFFFFGKSVMSGAISQNG